MVRMGSPVQIWKSAPEIARVQGSFLSSFYFPLFRPCSKERKPFCRNGFCLEHLKFHGLIRSLTGFSSLIFPCFKCPCSRFFLGIRCLFGRFYASKLTSLRYKNPETSTRFRTDKVPCSCCAGLNQISQNECR